MLSTKINDAILSEMKTFFDMSEEKYPDLSSKDLYNDLVVFLEVDRKAAATSSPKKEKKKRIVAEVPDDERCLALKKDGGRCNTKKSRTDMSGLCSLHKRSGPNYGVVTENTDVEDAEGIEGGESAVEQSESEPIEASAEIVVPPAKAKKTPKRKDSPKVAATVAEDPDQIEISPKKKAASKRKMLSTSKADKVSSSSAGKCCFVYGEGTNVGKECGRKTESSDKDLCKMHLVVAPKEESEDDEEISHAFVEDLVPIQDSDCEQYVKSDDD